MVLDRDSVSTLTWQVTAWEEVTPLKSTIASCPKNYKNLREDPVGEGKVTVMAKEMVKIDHFVLFPPIFFCKSGVLRIIL